MEEKRRSIPLPNPKALKRRRTGPPLPWALIRFVLFVTVASAATWWAYNNGHLEQYRPQIEHGWAVLTNNQETDHSAHASKTYTCPMHPEILRNKPGECPICGMDLVLKEDPAPPKEATYTCPMHPEILRDKPGECPICGMDLVKVEQEPETHEMSPQQNPNEVQIDPRMLNSLGVRTETATLRSLYRTLRVTGEIKTDDSQTEVLQSWVGGRIEKVYVDSVGQTIKKGQPLIEVYSPQLLATSEELVSALEYLHQLKQRNALPQAIADTQLLVESTEKRLRLWGLTEKQIQKIRDTREAQTQVVIFATGSGTVHRKMAYEGQQIKEGTPLYELINLSELWAYLSVFEQDLGLIHTGMPIEFTTPAFDTRFYGTVSEIEPMMDTQSRTGRVRVEISNPGSRLIPGMYVESELKIPVAQNRPTVSNLAVIRTGKRDLVIVAKGEGRFYPQEVKVGRLADGYYPILEGLSAGTRVVSQASFLIDSESQIKAALQQMKDGPAPGGHQH